MGIKHKSYKPYEFKELLESILSHLFTLPFRLIIIWLNNFQKTLKCLLYTITYNVRLVKFQSEYIAQTEE